MSAHLVYEWSCTVIDYMRLSSSAINILSLCSRQKKSARGAPKLLQYRGCWIYISFQFTIGSPEANANFGSYRPAARSDDVAPNPRNSFYQTQRQPVRLGGNLRRQGCSGPPQAFPSTKTAFAVLYRTFTLSGPHSGVRYLSRLMSISSL